MKTNRPLRQLRANSDLRQLKRQAKELLRDYLAGDANAVAEVNAYYRRAASGRVALHDAQLVLARSYGFDSWPKLKAYVDGATITRLGELVRADDLAAVRAMLKLRPELADMEMSYGNEHRPLHYAVMNRSAEMVRLLLRHGADPHRGIHPHREETTALQMAVDRGYDEIADILRKEEQRPSPVATRAIDDLRAAIAECDAARVASILTKEPALVNAQDREGRTPLDQAAIRGEKATPVAAVLRQGGASITPRSAVAAGDAAWLRARQTEGTLTNPVTWDAGGLLTVAVRNNRFEVLALLLDFGLDPEERVRSGDGASMTVSQGRPLWDCAALGRREMAELLLRHGANPNSGPDSSGSAVYSAYSHRQWEMVRFLREHGGVVGAGTAAIYRQTDLARQMLEDDVRGTLAAGVKSPGRSLAEDLLDFGASGGGSEIVRMALERIDWPRTDTRWFWFLQRPLDFWNHIPWLYAGDKDLDRGGYFECFRQILERCDPNLIGGFNRTVLHEVAASGDHITDEEAAPFAAALLDAGARTQVRDEIFRSTPLGWACRWGRGPVVELLLERGTDPSELDAEPWARPRAWAEKMGHAAIVGLLARHGG
jgi:ankyrin repeat protein